MAQAQEHLRAAPVASGARGASRRPSRRLGGRSGPDPRTWTRADRIGAAFVATALVGVSLVDAATTLLLVSTLGLVVVVAALVLHRWAVVLLAVLAVVCGTLLVALLEVPQEELRLVNVVVGAAVAVAVAAVRDLRSRDLRRLQHRDEQLLASLEEGVCGLDLAGRVTFANTALTRLLGWHEHELVGRPLHEVVHAGGPDDGAHDVANCPLLQALSGRRVAPVLSDVHRSRDGRSVPLDVVARPIEEDGEVVGAVVSMRDSAPRREAEAARERLIRLELQQAEHQRMVAALQRALLPDLPHPEGLDADVHYLPAEDGAPSGGDLYDALPLADGSLHLLVVDVAGKGVASTRDALRVVHTARALVLEGVAVGDLVGRLDRLLGSTASGVMATVVAARWHPGGHLQVAGGGHPPALLVRANGRAQWLDAPGRPVGFPEAGSDLVVEEELRPGDLLVLYTDGLVEGGRDLGSGLEALRAEAAARACEPLRGWAERLASHLLRDAVRRDDTLVLALRHEP